MISDEVLSYVRNSLAQGAPKSAVEQELSKAGWTGEQIAQIFEQASAVATAAPEASARSESLTKPITSPSTMSTAPTEQPASQSAGVVPKKRSNVGIIISVVVLLLVLGGAGAYFVLGERSVSQDSVANTETNPTQSGTQSQPDLVDQRNAFDAALQTPVLSDGQRLGSMLHQFSAIIPTEWGIVATTSEGYVHFDIVNAKLGAAGGVVRMSRYLQLYPNTVTLKEIAEKEREDLKSRAEGFKETSFNKVTIAGKEAYVIKAESTLEGTKVAITAYLFLDMGRYYIITGIEADGSTSSEFGAVFKGIVDSFEIASI